MADAVRPFSAFARNNTLACTTTSGSAFLTIADGGRATTLLIANVGATEAFFSCVSGATGVAAVAGGGATLLGDGNLSIPAGAVINLSCGEGPVTVAGITAASSTTLRVARGQGN